MSDYKLSKPGKDSKAKIKPTKYEGQQYPLWQLNHRDFEILLYNLFRNEISKKKLEKTYDDIWLLEGVRDGGRDCSMQIKGQSYGLIQCKHSINNDRITETKCAQEIIKFVLHYI